MKKGFFILFLLIIGGVAIITCPTREAHKESLLAVFKSILNDELDKDHNEKNVFNNFLISVIGNGVIELAIDQRLEVDNYIFFNIGRIGSDSQNARNISLGIFNHVFTFSKEEVKKNLESSLNEDKR